MHTRTLANVCLANLLLLAPSLAGEPTVVREEIVTRFSAANNGAGPLWCYGSPLVVRHGSRVYVSIIETGEDVPPLCNTRWQVWCRLDDAWQVVAGEQQYRQREPCPLVSLAEDGLFLSANPSLTPPGTRYRACQPTIFALRPATGTVLVTQESPVWSEAANFNDHSYRGIAADGERGEVLLLNIDTKTSEQFVSFRDRRGRWQARGKITFPIRAAYPQVGLRNGAAHVMAIGDIREPNQAWQQLKREVLKREWDYVFRRLFYCQAPDLADGGFERPIEIDSVDETAGHILNLDMHIDAGGAVHLLYLKKPHQYAFIRDRYFPGQAMTTSLEYVVLADAQVVHRASLVASTSQDAADFTPVYARFHVAPGERLSVIIAGTEQPAGQPARFVNVVMGLLPASKPQELNLNHPFRTFFSSAPRGGCEPSNTIDLFGTGADVPNLRYAEVRLKTTAVGPESADDD